MEKSIQLAKGSYLFAFGKEDYDRSLSLKTLSRSRKRRGGLTRKTKEKKEAKEERNRENLELNLRSLLDRLSDGRRDPRDLTRLRQRQRRTI